MWSYVGVSLAGICLAGLVRWDTLNLRLSSAIWVGLRRVIGAASRAFSLSVAMIRLALACGLLSHLAVLFQQRTFHNPEVL
ncbi:hypothetical protein J8Z82_14660 [Yersinia enterocolitica]|uniref:hypothetical protein n=1 Tax=Yersinia enterocolitica TaxID=630 RepID=UPI001C8D2BB9|nr:hypothetical protein [Yersinia enterocolitica]MBX9488821.1 hypothetical protein [Yersinia enterocolitica]MBX9493016.1 hypothetical protein [Yersinia enterocolitica]